MNSLLCFNRYDMVIRIPHVMGLISTADTHKVGKKFMFSYSEMIYVFAKRGIAIIAYKM